MWGLQNANQFSVFGTVLVSAENVGKNPQERDNGPIIARRNSVSPSSFERSCDYLVAAGVIDWQQYVH